MSASVTDYEDARFGVVNAFWRALDADRREPESLRAETLVNAAYVRATEFGWDWTDDGEFLDYALKATTQEALAEGLRRALNHERGELDV